MSLRDLPAPGAAPTAVPCRASAKGRHRARIGTGPGVSNNPASGFALAHLLAQAREALIPQLVRADTLALARWRVGELRQ